MKKKGEVFFFSGEKGRTGPMRDTAEGLRAALGSTEDAKWETG